MIQDRWKVDSTSNLKLADNPRSVLQEVNKVRAKSNPPGKPLTLKDITPILKAADDLNKLLGETFGYDHRVIVMGNGVTLASL
jgi:hypothetical protein